MNPVYWMDEKSGKMKAIVSKFFNDESLTDDELNTMRWYIHQFADAMPYKPNNLSEIFQMSQQELKAYISETLLFDFGIDPL